VRRGSHHRPPATLGYDLPLERRGDRDLRDDFRDFLIWTLGPLRAAGRLSRGCFARRCSMARSDSPPRIPETSRQWETGCANDEANLEGRRPRAEAGRTWEECEERAG